MGEVTTKCKVERKPRSKGVIRRQQIIDTARQTLIEFGITGIVLRDIAEKIGITHGNVQYYFATKDHLLVAVFDQELERYTESMHVALSESSTKSGRVSAIVDSAVEMIANESTSLWMMLFSLARQNPQLCLILERISRRYDESLAAKLSIVDPNLSPQRRHHIAQMIRMMLDGLGVHAAFEQLNSASMIALRGEMKAAILAWLDMNETG
ncbi:AcrR Transcriptional regulator [Sphingomonadaceae bacterium]